MQKMANMVHKCDMPCTSIFLFYNCHPHTKCCVHLSASEAFWVSKSPRNTDDVGYSTGRYIVAEIYPLNGGHLSYSSSQRSRLKNLRIRVIPEHLSFS